MEEVFFVLCQITISIRGQFQEITIMNTERYISHIFQHFLMSYVICPRIYISLIAVDSKRTFDIKWSFLRLSIWLCKGLLHILRSILAKNPQVALYFLCIMILSLKQQRIFVSKILVMPVISRSTQKIGALCTGEKGEGELGKPLHFKGSGFHRVIKGYWVRVAWVNNLIIVVAQIHVPGWRLHRGKWHALPWVRDFSSQTDSSLISGTGGESIYGEKFEDEAFPVNHTKPFLLSMVLAPTVALCTSFMPHV